MYVEGIEVIGDGSCVREERLVRVWGVSFSHTCYGSRVIEWSEGDTTRWSSKGYPFLLTNDMYKGDVEV